MSGTVTSSPRAEALDLALRAAEHALHEATAEYWLARADAFAAARPPRATPRGRARYRELSIIARACRAHATLVHPNLEQVEEVRALAAALLDALDDDIEQRVERLAATTHPDRADHWARELRILIGRRTAVALRSAALQQLLPQPPTDDSEPTAAVETQRAQLSALTAARARLEAA